MGPPRPPPLTAHRQGQNPPLAPPHDRGRHPVPAPSWAEIGADQGYTGGFQRWVHATVGMVLEVVYPWWRQLGRDDPELLETLGLDTTFNVMPRRWVLERTLALLVKNRRLGRHSEALPGTTEMLVYLAMIRSMLARLVRTSGEHVAGRPGPGSAPSARGADRPYCEACAPRWESRSRLRLHRWWTSCGRAGRKMVDGIHRRGTPEGSRALGSDDDRGLQS